MRAAEPQALGSFEQVSLDQRRVLSRVPRPAERDFAAVDAVAKQLEDRGPAPGATARRAQTPPVEPCRDRATAQLAGGIALEHIAHDLNRGRVGCEARAIGATNHAHPNGEGLKCRGERTPLHSRGLDWNASGATRCHTRNDGNGDGNKPNDADTYH